MSYLKKLKVDRLKVDQNFVIDMIEDANDASIVKAIIALGKNLGLDVVAEGVETERHAQLLIELGCDVGQGWFFGRPGKYLNKE